MNEILAFKVVVELNQVSIGLEIGLVEGPPHIAELIKLEVNVGQFADQIVLSIEFVVESGPFGCDFFFNVGFLVIPKGFIPEHFINFLSQITQGSPD